jgi:hypothetical protein
VSGVWPTRRRNTAISVASTLAAVGATGISAAESTERFGHEAGRATRKPVGSAKKRKCTKAQRKRKRQQQKASRKRNR